MGNPSDSSRKDRYRSWARDHVHRPSSYFENNAGGNIARVASQTNPTETGGLDEKNGGYGHSPPTPTVPAQNGGQQGIRSAEGNGDSHSSTTDTLAAADDDDAIPRDASAAPPPIKSEAAGNGDPSIASAVQETPAKKPIGQRMRAGCRRFVLHLKHALTYSWVNVLLVFVPLGIIVDCLHLSPGIVFGMNAVAIVPLAGLLSFATEAVASRLGDTLGALLNVSFGNAVELIIFIIALVHNEIEIVQASLLGSILSNLLLILGMAFVLGGLRYREQIYNSTVTQMSACLLSLSVVSLLLPTAFYASFKSMSADLADKQVLKVSRGTSVVLLIVYILYLLFQLKSHAYMYESTPQEVIDEESHPGVLADIMNSSSSSDASSSSDDNDSDTSGSGSVIAAGRKIRRAFKNRRRRKSSMSAGSTTYSLSSPSTQEHQGNYWESSIRGKHTSRRPSQLVGIPIDIDADADHEGDAEGQPRIRDFGGINARSEGSSASPDRKELRKMKKTSKRMHKKHGSQKTADAPSGAGLSGGMVQSPARELPKSVGFAEHAETIEPSGIATTQSGSSFNMRQFSSRVRPGLPKLLSNNVFVTPPPGTTTPVNRPLAAVRSHSSGTNLRRISSLPDRLNREESNQSFRNPQPSRTEPLPPFQHQRFHNDRQAAEALNEPGNDGGEGEDVRMSRTAAVVLLLCTTALVAVCAEFMVSVIPAMIASSPNVSQAFVGLILLPIVSNAAEHVTAVTVATKNKMDLAIAVAVGSSIQIALFVTPIIVLLGWILDTNMSLYFNLFETISLFLTAFVVNFLVLDGRSNYLEGSLLIAAYVIIALGAFFYPSAKDQSQIGGGA